MQEALNSLDPVDREILSLRHFEELTAAEAAQVLGIEESAAAKRDFRALKRLKTSPRRPARRAGRSLTMATLSSERYVLLNRLADEFAERYRRGERPSLQEYVDRHPDLADDIRELLPGPGRGRAGQGRPPGGAGAAAPPARRRRSSSLGDYRILREIGHGGMGVVYEAEQVSLGRHVALKVLPQQLRQDARTRSRFEREAKAAAKLHHTNIVPVFGVGEHDGLRYYVMQFIQGLGLDEVLEELKRLAARARWPCRRPQG